MSRRRFLMLGLAAAVGFAAPALAQTSVPTETIDPFGQDLTMTAKPIVYVEGATTWDIAFDTLVEAFKKLQAYLDQAGLKATGPLLTIYTSADDTGFQFQAAAPLSEPPKAPPPAGIAVGTSPEGRVLKFVHRGSYDAMDSTYEAITNHLDEKGLEAKDLYIEEYLTDPVTTPEDKLVINVFVPVK